MAAVRSRVSTERVHLIASAAAIAAAALVYPALLCGQLLLLAAAVACNAVCGAVAAATWPGWSDLLFGDEDDGGDEGDEGDPDGSPSPDPVDWAVFDEQRASWQRELAASR